MVTTTPLTSTEVTVGSDRVELTGELRMPAGARGIVLFAHGSGSSRLSPRNRAVAGALNDASLATLLFDLLTPNEAMIDERTGALRFDIALLSQRLVGAIDWAHTQPSLRALRIGLFGASTGAAATLIAAAHCPQRIGAVVSRGGRPDLAMDELARVRAPTLLIVGGLDGAVIRMNRSAAKHLQVEHEVAIVPGATHLFEEPGKLDEVARLACAWFAKHLA